MSERRSLSSRFHESLAGAGGSVELDLLPTRLARAAAAATGADGASLSLLSMDLRVPLGASSAAATAAERLQFAVGEGPCLDVLRDGTPTRADAVTMARTWPLFARDLVTATPYRSVAAVPLAFTDDGAGGALDLYLEDPYGSDDVDLLACAVMADQIVVLLAAAIAPRALAGTDDASKVPWLHTESARARMEVWVAIGMLTKHLGLETTDALAVLRAWAHTHGTDLDSVAARTVSGELDAEQFRP